MARVRSDEVHLTAMPLNQKSTAILFFARSAKSEDRFKSLFQKDRINRQLLSLLHDSSLSTAKKSGIPIFQISEEQQRGKTFGERISNAFQDVFAQGYQQVISIGGDCPDISVVDIKQAERLIQNHSIVVGPDERGGAYLIGLSRSSFDKGAFHRLKWKSHLLVDSLVGYAEELGVQPVLMRSKFDVNSREDFNWIVQHSTELMHFLRMVLRKNTYTSLLEQPFIELHAVGTSRRRGPPNWEY